MSPTQPSTFAFIVTFALSRREIGQPALAAFAISRIFFPSAPGTFAVTSRCDSVTVGPAGSISSVTVAVAAMDSGLRPALPSSDENAIAKQPACAAAMSSSGLVPTPFSKRVLKEYCVSLSVPLSEEMLPWPSFKLPFQTADALRFMMLLSMVELDDSSAGDFTVGLSEAQAGFRDFKILAASAWARTTSGSRCRAMKY